MADKTFRQTVEEILINGIKANEPVQGTLDAICSAVLKMAEGMPRWDYSTAENFGIFHAEDNALIRGRNKQYSECQDYIRKQVERTCAKIAQVPN